MKSTIISWDGSFFFITSAKAQVSTSECTVSTRMAVFFFFTEKTNILTCALWPLFLKYQYILYNVSVSGHIQTFPSPPGPSLTVFAVFMKKHAYFPLSFHQNALLLLEKKSHLSSQVMCLFCLSQNIFQIFEVTRKCVINYILYHVAVSCFFKVQWPLQVSTLWQNWHFVNNAAFLITLKGHFILNGKLYIILKPTLYHLNGIYLDGKPTQHSSLKYVHVTEMPGSRYITLKPTLHSSPYILDQVAYELLPWRNGTLHYLLKSI